jgi:uncharacterized sulfatase
MLYEGGIRSPLIAWAPGRIDAAKAGSINETAVFAAFDLVPSLLKIAAVETSAGVTFDGEDFSATILGKAETPRKAPIFWRRPPDRKRMDNALMPDLAVRDGKWKLLCDYDGSKPKLYDLEADRGETKDLAAEKAEVVARLTKLVVAWHKSLPADKGAELAGGAPAKPKKAKH